VLFITATLFADQPQKQEKAKEPAKQDAAKPDEDQPPPDEDAAAAAKVYTFNPLQAQKEVRVGDYYFKKGSYRAAAQRYREATKWNAGYADAWLRLGEAAEKENDHKAAAEAYTKYLELQPDPKIAAEVKKKLEKLKRR
jgi:predicted TPR repeat methyltransferase